MRDCAACARQLEDEFRFCPHCGAAQRLKVIEYFRGHPDLDDGFLRVSAYLTSPAHTRFSVWRGERADAVISLEPYEAQRLGRFLLGTVAAQSRPAARESALRRSARALRATLTGARR